VRGTADGRQEAEIFRESLDVALYRLDKSPRFDFVELGKVRAEHDFLSTSKEDARLDTFRGDNCLRGLAHPSISFTGHAAVHRIVSRSSRLPARRRSASGTSPAVLFDTSLKGAAGFPARTLHRAEPLDHRVDRGRSALPQAGREGSPVDCRS
jgi:hypothetical protein